MLAAVMLEPVKAIVVGAAVFIPFERLASLHPRQRILRQGWAMDLLTGVMNGLLLYVVLLTALGGVNAVAALGAPQLRQWIEVRSILTQSIIALIVGDLGVYGIHRLQHTLPWLWRFHAVHHSAEEMDWMVGFRFHPLDIFLLRLASLGPLVALNISPAAIAVFMGVSGWQAWLVHANIRMPYGPLRWLLVSPEFHHWHHSAEQDAYNTNYASLLASWDVLFGTLFLPRGRQPLHYGIEETMPPGWIGRFFHPFRGPAASSAEASRPVNDRQAAPAALNSARTRA